MAVEIGDGGLGRIYLGDILIAGKPVTPPEDTTTVCFSWCETSAPDGINIKYGGDASSRGKGSNCWDKFFGYSAVLMDNQGNVCHRITQEDSGGYGCLNMCCLAAKGALSGGCNVMIEFPRMGYKLSKSGCMITACLTRCSNASGFKYYAFNRGGPTSGAYDACLTQPYMYLGAYKSFLSGQNHSWSGCSPTVCQNIDVARCCSHDAYGTSSHYQQIAHWQKGLLNLYYVGKRGCLNSQCAIGCGYVNASAKTNTGGTNSRPGASWGCNTNGTNQAKMFGLEDWWGNVYERVDGIYGTNVETSNTPACIANRSSNTWVSSGVGTGSGWITGVAGTDLGMFIPTCFSGGGTTYYSDSGAVCSSCVAGAGGAWKSACAAGAFLLYVYYSPSCSNSTIGSRLMYL